MFLLPEFVAEWADFNTVFYDSVFMLKGSTQIVDPGPSFRMRRLWISWRHEYDLIESHDVIDDVTHRRAVGIFL